MSGIIEQLELDHTFFYQLAIFAFLLFFLGNFFFRPFLKLFEARHKRTVEDREAAERLMQQAQAKLDEYKDRLTDERSNARKEFESILNDARKEESQILSQAREEAKRISQEAAQTIEHQHTQIKKQLEADVEEIAKNISDKLLVRKY